MEIETIGDIETNNDSKSNGYHIGFVGKGEWIKYTVNVKEAGLYRADFRHASAADGARFYLSNNDQNLTSVLSTNSTGSWFDFITTSMNGLVLNEGNQEIKIHFDSNNEVNISSIEFVKVGEINQANFSSVSIKLVLMRNQLNCT